MGKLKTILVVGDVPRSIGNDMVCIFLDAGYKVKAPDKFVYRIDGNLIGHLSQMDFFSGSTLTKENDNFTEIEYNLGNEKKLKEIISGCYAVVYLTYNLYDYRDEINSNLGRLISQEPLTSIADISKACGVHQFICGSIPIMYRNEDDPQVTEDVRMKGLIDYYSNYHDLCKEYFKKLAAEQFVFTIVQPCIFPSDSHRRKLDLNVITFTNHTINNSKIRLFGNSKKQVCPIPVDKDGMILNNLRLDVGYGKGESYIYECHIKGIFDLCLFILEHPADKVNKKNWFYRVMYQGILEHFYFGRYLADFLRKPRVPFLGRMKFVARAIKRLFDASMMMFLLHVWPEQVYRFSTRKLLPNKSERFNMNDKPTVPFELIEERTSKIQRTEEINVVMRGSSFDISNLDNLNGPIYLVNFNCPIETQKDVIYLEQSIPNAYVMQQLGFSVCHVEVNRVAENGKRFPPNSYLSLKWYEKLLDKPNFKRIAIAEKICRPFKLPLSSSWRPAGAGLNAICALSYFADKINVYGWDFYLESSPDDMSYWELFSNLYKFRLDVFRSRLHFECAIINFYYGYHLSKLNNIKIYGYIGQLNRHEKLIKKIDRVLFNQI